MNTNILSSKSAAFYPGSGVKFDTILTLVVSDIANIFIFVDCGISRSDLVDHFKSQKPCSLSREERLGMAMQMDWDDEFFLDYTVNTLKKPTGYTLECLEDLPLDSLFPLEATRHVPEEGGPLVGVGAKAEPYAVLGRFRKREGDPLVAHWPETLLFLFLGTEAITTYDLLFCQEGQQAPKVVILQAGMHIGWGNGSPLHVLAQETARLPDFQLLIDPKPDPWEGYELLDGDIWRRIG